ncbi:MAG: hypothetical protein SVQ76_00045 [Candidatus Nanohaloarchaea archaeon]|nr:hypothetical protein [Candidatus Nanohaloarchaea archaeon]
MRAEFQLEVPEDVGRAVGPSLRSSDRVSFEVEQGDGLQVGIETEDLGALRGASNTALMLSKLSNRFMEKR